MVIVLGNGCINTAQSFGVRLLSTHSPHGKSGNGRGERSRFYALKTSIVGGSLQSRAFSVQHTCILRVALNAESYMTVVFRPCRLFAIVPACGQIRRSPWTSRHSTCQPLSIYTGRYKQCGARIGHANSVIVAGNNKPLTTFLCIPIQA